jgi:tetratricopeptide (TPR) repeat protein
MPANWKLRHYLGFLFYHKCADFPERTVQDFGEDNFTLARRYLRQALALNPEAPLYVDRLIIHTYERQADFETARRLYDLHLAKYPEDATARQNRDEFLRNKEQYHYFINEAVTAFRQGNADYAVEIYEDHLRDTVFRLPFEAAEAVLRSYMQTGEFDAGLSFVRRLLRLKIDDPEAVRSLYTEYIRSYNRQYGTELLSLSRTGNAEGMISLYEEKFTEKNVEISLENGILVFDAMMEAGYTEKAADLLRILSGAYPEEERLKPYSLSPN